MGFSVSGSAAIVFAGMFIAFGMFYSASANSVEQVNDARSEWQDNTLAQQNTDIDLLSATHYTGNDSLVVRVRNTGAVGLSLSETDLLVDNTYQDNVTERSVDGDADTDLWLAGETLRYNVSTTSQPGRVKLVTGTGVAAAAVVQSG